MEYLRLVKGVDEWVLPENAWIDAVQFTVRRSESDRALQHGSIDTGDGKIDARTLDMTIAVNEATAADYFAIMDGIKRRLYRRDQKLYVAPKRYIGLSSLYQFKEKFVPGLVNRMSTVEAEFKCNDPFFYDDMPQVAIANITSSTTVLSVENIGNVDVPPMFTVTAFGALPYIRVTSQTNGRMSYYQDPQFVDGSILIVDTALATVTRNGINTLNNFNGAFHVLEVGENVFTIEASPNCTVQVSYIPRWL